MTAASLEIIEMESLGVEGDAAKIGRGVTIGAAGVV